MGELLAPAPSAVDTIPTPPGRTSRTRPRGTRFVAPVLATLLGAGVGVVAPGTASASEAWQSPPFQVSSTGAVKRSGYLVIEGQQFSVVTEGSWNTNIYDPNSPDTGPEGNPLNAQGDVTCKRVPEITTGAMVGKIDGPGNEDPTFPVRNGIVITPTTSGEVVFFDNEKARCAWNNGGALETALVSRVPLRHV